MQQVLSNQLPPYASTTQQMMEPLYEHISKAPETSQCQQLRLSYEQERHAASIHAGSIWQEPTNGCFALAVWSKSAS